MTVRARVTAAATLAVIIVLVVSGAVLVHLQRQTLTSSLDESLVRMSDGLIADGYTGTQARILHPRGDEDIVGQFVAPNGEVLAATANLVGRSRISRWVAPVTGARIGQVDALMPNGIPDRLLARRFISGGRGVVTLYVGAPLDDVRDNVRFLTRSMTAAVPLMAAILAALVWWLVGRTLHPVERIRAQVAEMGGTDTDKRVPEPAGDDEIARLAKTMNAMLSRIDDARQRQQRFVADASHELRTPLTRMRAEIEVDLAHPEGADAGATASSVLEELSGLQQLVEDLLLLARSDAGVAPQRERVDLAEIVVGEAQLAAAEGLVIDTHAVAPACVFGDPEQLRRVVRNLVANATRYAHGRIGLSLRADDDGVRLWIDDDGPGVPTDERERIFERFTRVDDARAAGTGGAGLGLAIARDIVERHGGTVRAIDGASAGARFEVHFQRRA
ncbi:MAG: HAMP domain-containing protein [Actinobacteria bacterium]|nr:HAMP domain-containing protein [Actinomycetota bacterium]